MWQNLIGQETSEITQQKKEIKNIPY